MVQLIELDRTFDNVAYGEVGLVAFHVEVGSCAVIFLSHSLLEFGSDLFRRGAHVLPGGDNTNEEEDGCCESECEDCAAAAAGPAIGCAEHRECCRNAEHDTPRLQQQPHEGEVNEDRDESRTAPGKGQSDELR